MKKIFKTLTIAILAVSAAIACAFAAGCGDKSGETKSDYNFTIVYEDGKAVNGLKDGADGGVVMTQICLPGGSCIPLLPDFNPDANGKLSISQAKINEFLKDLAGTDGDVTKFVFHVIGIPNHKEDCEVEVDGKGDYKVIVTNA